MVDWNALNGIGFNSYTQNVLKPNYISTPYGLVPNGQTQTSNFASSYVNGQGPGASRLRFQVSSSLPGNGPFSTTLKTKEFDGANQMGGVLSALGKANVLDIPWIGLGEGLANPNLNPVIMPDWLKAWGSFFSTPAQNRFQFPMAYTA